MYLVTENRIINMAYVKEIFVSSDRTGCLSIEKSDGKLFTLVEYRSKEEAKTALAIISKRLELMLKSSSEGVVYMPSENDIQAVLAAEKQPHRDDRTAKGHKIKRHGGS